jgi:hypothetical protein
MHGVFASTRAATLYLLAWLILGLLLAAMLAVGGSAWSAGLVFAVPLVLLYAVATGFSAYYVCRAYPLGQRGGAAIASGILLSACCAALAWCVAAAVWNGLWRALAPREAAIDMNAAVTATMFALGVLLYVLAAAVNYLLVETERVRQLETQRLQMKLTAQDAELRMLRTQVDPHFLFNSLNSISALTAIDPARARAMIVQLADFFRDSLRLHADQKVTLARELQLIRHFVAIEQVRFGDRLDFEMDADDAALACLVPPMLLQPLVENAVKHGVAGMIGFCRVRLAAARAGSVLRVRVENGIDPDAPPASAGRGIGLANVHQRLAAAYGHEAGIHWTRDDDRHIFRVELALPAETEED